MTYQVGGLIFESKDDYYLFLKIDNDISKKVKLVEKGKITIEEIFSDVKSINVKETYFNAREEMDRLFQDATNLLCYEGTRYHSTNYELGKKFFEKINIIEYSEDESEDESDGSDESEDESDKSDESDESD